MTLPRKIMVVAGTRPEAIKVAPVVRKLRDTTNFEVCLCTTGQHREMLHQVLELFGLAPDIDLDLMRPDQSLSGFASAAITALDRAMAAERPDRVLVQGDTSTALAAAISAFHLGIEVAHLEAGLRSFDPANPFPEEANRRMIACVASIHLAPTERAEANLLGEGVPRERIRLTGNTVVDAVQWVASLPERTDRRLPPQRSGSRRILLTVHRRENHGQPLDDIITAVRQLIELYRHRIDIVLPVHPNPKVRAVVEDRLGGLDAVHLVPPLAYDELVAVMRSAHLVLTDSGGIQEEAPGLGTPVLVLRRTTERPEGVDAGVAKLVGTSTEDIIKAVAELLDNDVVHRQMARAINPYGDGHASERVVAALSQPSKMTGGQ